MTLKSEILYCLEHCPETRNSDVELMIRVWLTFHADKLIQSQKNGKWYVELINMFELPREDCIKRWRARIQNIDGRFLPTNPRIWEERQRQATKWRKDLGYGQLHKAIEENGAKIKLNKIDNKYDKQPE